MENKQDYLLRLQAVIEHLHICGAFHRETVTVHEIFRGQTVWQDVVEIFDLYGNSKAKRAYAWRHSAGLNYKGDRFVIMLEIPPVVSPMTAVQTSMMSDAKK